MMDVIEEMGFDVSHRCYWDFGRWSDLCRVWRRAGDDLQPEEVLNFEVCLFTFTAGCDQADVCSLLSIQSSELAQMRSM
jgi:hypothetical protein